MLKWFVLAVLTLTAGLGVAFGLNPDFAADVAARIESAVASESQSRVEAGEHAEVESGAGVGAPAGSSRSVLIKTPFDFAFEFGT